MPKAKAKATKPVVQGHVAPAMTYADWLAYFQKVLASKREKLTKLLGEVAEHTSPAYHLSSSGRDIVALSCEIEQLNTVIHSFEVEKVPSKMMMAWLDERIVNGARWVESSTDTMSNLIKRTSLAAAVELRIEVKAMGDLNA